MSTLQGKTVASTYKDLLQISNNNIGVDTSVRYIEDGEGTPSVLGLSTSIVEVAGSIIPDVTLTRDLGSNTRRFRDLYLSGTTIHLGDEVLNQGMIHTIKDVQNGAYATNIQGAKADTALQPGSHINFVDVIGRPSTLAGYGITDAATRTYVDDAIVSSQGTTNWSNITNTPSTLAGYGITDAATSAQGVLADSALQSGDNILFENITERPSTLTGYGITDAATSAQGILADSALQSGSVNFGDLNATPSTLAGYGITDAATSAQGVLADSAVQLSELMFNNILNTPTTLAGYGIIDAATLSQGNKADSALQPGEVIDFTWIGGTPNTLAGYGITDAASVQYVDDSIIASQGTNDWSNITGRPTTIAGYGITDAFNGNFSSLIGRPTTIAGYGITDAFDGLFTSLSNLPTTLAGYGITDAFDGDFNSLQNLADAYLYTNIKAANSNTTSHVVFVDTVGNRQVCVDPGSFAYDDGTKTLTIVNLDVTSGFNLAGAPVQLFDGNFNSLQNKTDAYELTRTQQFLNSDEYFVMFSSVEDGDEIVNTDPSNFKYDTSTGTLLVSNIDASNNVLINGVPVGTGSFDGLFTSLSNLPTTLAGYGITDAFDVNDPGDIVPATNMSNTLGTMTKHWNNMYTHDIWVHNSIEASSGTYSNSLSVPSLTFTNGTGDILNLAQHLQTPLIQNTSNITLDPAGDVGSQGKVIVLGDLDVRGTTTTIDSTTLSISGKNITLANGAVTAAEADGAGLNIQGPDVEFTYDASNDRMDLNKSINIQSDSYIQGNVGIGTTSPNAELEVFGQIISNRRYMSDNSLELVSDWTDSGETSIISFKIDGQGAMNEKMRINSTGDVGIGTTTPGARLHVVDDDGGLDCILESSGDFDLDLVLRAGATTPHSFYLNVQDQSDLFKIWPGTSGSTTGFAMDGNGNVGIGTDTPSKPLHVAANAHQFILEDTNAAAGEKMRGIFNNNNNLNFARYTDDLSDAFTDLIITNTGNVGIGTNTPGNLLHVAGTGHTKVLAEGGDNHAVGFQMQQNLYNAAAEAVDPQVWQLQTQAGTNALQIRNGTTGSVDMHFHGNGNVGIGSGIPSGKFQVNHDFTGETTGQQSFFRVENSMDSTHNSAGATLYSSDNGGAGGREQQVHLCLQTRDPELAAHGGSAWMVYSNPEGQGTYGTGQLDFYLRHGGAYVPPNYPGFSDLSQYYLPPIFTIKSDGKLGVGTNEPRGALDIRNNTHHWMSFGYTGDGMGEHRLVWDSSKVFLQSDTDNAVGGSGIGLTVDGAIGYWQAPGGNTRIGIGTDSTPPEALQVMGAMNMLSTTTPASNTGGTLWYNAAAGANGAFLFKDDSNTTRVLDGTLTYNYSGTVWQGGVNSGDLHYSLGQVAIAHDDPGEALAVRGNIFSWHDTTTPYYYLGNAKNHRDAYMARPSTATLSFGRFLLPPGGGWQESARFDENGLFGINTTNPISQLHLKDGVLMNSGWRRMMTLEAGHPTIQFKGTQQEFASAWIGLDDATATEGLQFRTGGSTDQITDGVLAMSINKSGNIAIGGHKYPISPLHVQGNISVTSGNVAVSGALQSNNGEGGGIEIESRASSDPGSLFGIPIAGQSYLRTVDSEMIIGSSNSIAFAPDNTINFYYDTGSWYMSSNLMPETNMAYNLGSVSQHWDNVYSHDFWIHNLLVFATGEQIGATQVTQWNNSTTNLQTLETQHDNLSTVVQTNSANWSVVTDVTELTTVVNSNSSTWGVDHTADIDNVTTTVQTNSASWDEVKTPQRTIAQALTTSVPDNTGTDLEIIGVAKSYMLMKIETSAAAWVTLYVDDVSRVNDANRNETTDPTPGSGVVAEVISSGPVSQIITPGILGFNNDTPVNNVVYAKVVNKSGSTTAITVTLTFLPLEN